MIIITKFKPGQEVWIMQDNKPIKLIIDYITVVISGIFNKKVKYEILYHLINTSFNDKFKENEIYATKEDLKNSLFD